jgi:hypothetical protein
MFRPVGTTLPLSGRQEVYEGVSSDLVAACPLEGLVGRPSSLKKAAPLVHLWFAQYHAGFWKSIQDQVFHQNEQELQ